jgi:hypothetical protein
MLWPDSFRLEIPPVPIQAKLLFRADVLKPKLDAFMLPYDFEKRLR